MTRVLWDVDTQFDFVFPNGKLYVPGAEQALPAMARLVEGARRAGIPHVASADDHELSDPEISAKPDFVMSVLVGGNHISFYRQWAAVGMNKTVPVASTNALFDGTLSMPNPDEFSHPRTESTCDWVGANWVLTWAGLR